MIHISIQAFEMLSRFKGCLVGAVVGDCLGMPFEGWSTVSMKAVCRKLKVKESKGEDNISKFKYTDDTAMARSVAESLIHIQGIDCKDMARRFSEEYYKQPNRGYGGNVINVFSTLKETNYEDVLAPAASQFDGSGSYGNGGAMRIAPAALFGYNHDVSKLNELCDHITSITHSHRDALRGAKLQAVAVHLALRQKEGTLSWETFIESLLNIMSELEEEDQLSPPAHKRRAKRPSEEEANPYCFKLKEINRFMKSEKEVQVEELVEVLGNDVSALGSVPAAIYSFLRASKPIQDYQTDNPFERSIAFAISLGGDTDTIATMTGAIAGAYYGLESIPFSWRKVCEGISDAEHQAEMLFKLV